MGKRSSVKSLKCQIGVGEWFKTSGSTFQGKKIPKSDLNVGYFLFPNAIKIKKLEIGVENGFPTRAITWTAQAQSGPLPKALHSPQRLFASVANFNHSTSNEKPDLREFSFVIRHSRTR
ncbi:hypothetical protein NPIL_542241 [Nephila pilipes]|uniref:Uncharacterized protein n=1 Tax=Nephila pilipes TaxID=299642 RepID=A0A8X6PP11_NEPPI|nr:hypothetical protein NPIL_542241 [Nephila pilipes]